MNCNTDVNSPQLKKLCEQLISLVVTRGVNCRTPVSPISVKDFDHMLNFYVSNPVVFLIQQNRGLLRYSTSDRFNGFTLFDTFSYSEASQDPNIDSRK